MFLFLAMCPYRTSQPCGRRAQAHVTVLPGAEGWWISPCSAFSVLSPFGAQRRPSCSSPTAALQLRRQQEPHLGRGTLREQRAGANWGKLARPPASTALPSPAPRSHGSALLRKKRRVLSGPWLVPLSVWEIFHQLFKHSGFLIHFKSNKKMFSYTDGRWNESKAERKPIIPGWTLF